MTEIFTATGGNQLIAQLEEARAKLDRGTDLINEALDLLEQFEWAILDPEDPTAMAAALKRAIDAHRRQR